MLDRACDDEITRLEFNSRTAKLPSANLASKFKFKHAKNLENQGPGGYLIGFWDQKMEQISILDAPVALELSWWRLGKFEKVLGERFGTVLTSSWVPTWTPKWSQLD